MELPEAYRLLGLSAKEREFFVWYFGNLRRHGLDQEPAARVALHLVDRCDKQLGGVFGTTRRAINHSVVRWRKRLGAGGDCALLRLIQIRPPRGSWSYQRANPIRRPFTRGANGHTTNPDEVTGA